MEDRFNSLHRFYKKMHSRLHFFKDNFRKVFNCRKVLTLEKLVFKETKQDSMNINTVKYFILGQFNIKIIFKVSIRLSTKHC